jgi:ubiquitin-protein ligase
MKKSLKRIINIDAKCVQTKLLNNNGIFLEFDQGNMFHARAMIIGPDKSVYKHGFLLFDILFPKDYPFNPPDIVYCPSNKIRIHPNLYTHGGRDGLGKICLSILGTWHGPKWTSVMDIGDVLLSILSLLDNNPLQHEPGYEKDFTPLHKQYSTIIQNECYYNLFIKNAIKIIKNKDNGFHIFSDIVKEYISNHKETIMNEIKKYKSKKISESRIKMVQLYQINEYKFSSNNLLNLFEYILSL